MAVTGHTVMSDSACRASALGASVVASATASATRAPGSYIEVWGTNTTTGGSTLTAVDLNFTINRLD